MVSGESNYLHIICKDIFLFPNRAQNTFVFFIPKSFFLLFNQNVNQNLIRLILDIVDSDDDAPGAVIAANSVRII